MGMLTEPARKLADKGAVGTLQAVKRRCGAGLTNVGVRLSKGVGASLGRLPPRMAFAARNSISTVTTLDYGRASILLNVDSETDLMRASACRKEPDTVRWIEKNIRAGDVFYDVGANVGAYAMIASQQEPGRVMSHAFEPSFSTYHQLCNNVILNGYEAQVFPHLIALGGRNGTSVLNYQSLVAGAALHAVGPSVDYRGDDFRPVYEQRVLVFSLDELVWQWGFDMPNHIKIDVDGTELEVLEGARRVLCDPRLRTVLIEMCHDRGNSDAILGIMAESGFELESQVFLQSSVSNGIFTRKAP